LYFPATQLMQVVTANNDRVFAHDALNAIGLLITASDRDTINAVSQRIVASRSEPLAQRAVDAVGRLITPGCVNILADDAVDAVRFCVAAGDVNVVAPIIDGIVIGAT